MAQCLFEASLRGRWHDIFCSKLCTSYVKEQGGLWGWWEPGGGGGAALALHPVCKHNARVMRAETLV